MTGHDFEQKRLVAQASIDQLVQHVREMHRHLSDEAVFYSLLGMCATEPENALVMGVLAVMELARHEVSLDMDG